MKTVALLLSCFSAFAADIYVSPSGSDSTGTGTVAQPYATFAHAIGTIARPMPHDYVVDGASGSYAEPLDVSGLVGYVVTIQNATFTGTKTGCIVSVPLGPFTVGACIPSLTNVVLSNVTINTTARDGIECDRATMTMNGLTVQGNLLNGINTSRCIITSVGTNTVQGYTWLGIYAAHFSDLVLNTGTLNVYGPGGTPNTSWGINAEWMSSIEVMDPSFTLNVSNTMYALGITGHSNMSVFVGGTINLTNSTVPASSAGIALYNESTFDQGGGRLIINGFTNCVLGYGLTEFSAGPNDRTFSNCNPYSPNQGSVFTPFGRQSDPPRLLR